MVFSPFLLWDLFTCANLYVLLYLINKDGEIFGEMFEDTIRKE